MWQHHYVIHMMRMDELRAEADRERRWRLEDLLNSRRADPPVPGWARFHAARWIAGVSRTSARLARRLDARVCIEREPERLLPGA